MRVTKLGHCCLVVEENGVRMMTDPGAWTPLETTERAPFLTEHVTLREEAKNIDYVFITHEHQDHFHIDSLKMVLRNNSKAQVITNRSVGKLLEKEDVKYSVLDHGGAGEFSGVQVEWHGEKHAVIYKKSSDRCRIPVTFSRTGFSTPATLSSIRISRLRFLRSPSAARG